MTYIKAVYLKVYSLKQEHYRAAETTQENSSFRGSLARL